MLHPTGIVHAKCIEHHGYNNNFYLPYRKIEFTSTISLRLHYFLTIVVLVAVAGDVYYVDANASFQAIFKPASDMWNTLIYTMLSLLGLGVQHKRNTYITD